MVPFPSLEFHKATTRAQSVACPAQISNAMNESTAKSGGIFPKGGAQER
jgi:hypothetical protein